MDIMNINGRRICPKTATPPNTPAAMTNLRLCLVLKYPLAANPESWIIISKHLYRSSDLFIKKRINKARAV